MSWTVFEMSARNCDLLYWRRQLELTSNGTLLWGTKSGEQVCALNHQKSPTMEKYWTDEMIEEIRHRKDSCKF